ncbi:MAG: hypothetical protein L3K00_06830 [Thermoplasmata archaeon]|nr:hypothetical protein [Thermoplasmata archaeon]
MLDRPDSVPRIRNYEVRVTLPAPLAFAYRWCTDYSPSDGQHSGEGYRRRILERSSRQVTLEDLYDTERGWTWIRRVIRLHPPSGWRAESVGSDRMISVEYRLSRVSVHRTQLTIRARRRPYGIGTTNPPRAVWEHTVAQSWKQLSRALGVDYQKSVRGTRAAK